MIQSFFAVSLIMYFTSCNYIRQNKESSQVRYTWVKYHDPSQLCSSSLPALYFQGEQVVRIDTFERYLSNHNLHVESWKSSCFINIPKNVTYVEMSPECICILDNILCLWVELDTKRVSRKGLLNDNKTDSSPSPYAWLSYHISLPVKDTATNPLLYRIYFHQTLDKTRVKIHLKDSLLYDDMIHETGSLGYCDPKITIPKSLEEVNVSIDSISSIVPLSPYFDYVFFVGDSDGRLVVVLLNEEEFILYI